ncbi:MAG TPA: coniferyl aldehyde dehydrogenase [Polyangiaceae bacterium]|nr:coniferyl aldehyde dehydrogenase [Polyangiaceae bacterium]
MNSSPAPLEPSTRTGADDPQGVLVRLREASRKDGIPSADARIASLESLGQSLARHKDAVAEAIANDFGGRSKHETLIVDVFTVLAAIKHVKAHLRGWMDAEHRETSWVFLPSTCEVVRQPLGVVGIISPWNYPVQLCLSPLVSVLAAGNRAMIKPSELVPNTADVLARIVSEALPADQVVVVTGGAHVGEAFARLPFDHLVFTGSTRVGKLVMRAASENLVPVTLELGGKSPAVVGADFDTRIAAARIMAGKTFNGGQTCVAPDYALIPEGTEQAFVEGCAAAVAHLYPTLANNPDYTAIVSDPHHARIRALVADAKARGAKVVELNPAGEAFDAASRKMVPTLVLETNGEMACMQEEIFGPVLPVVTYRELADAIRYINDRPRPLAVYYFGHDREATERVLSETVSGGVTINETTLHVLQDDLPFGGVGPSGMGRYHGREGFETFSQQKAVYRQSRISTTALLRPPYRKTADRLLRFLLGS